MEIIDKTKKLILKLLGKDEEIKIKEDSQKLKNAERYDCDINIGLSNSIVAERVADKLTNQKPINRTKSYGRIIFENIFNFCNTVTIILVALLFIAGAGMYAVSSVIVIANIAIGIWQEIKAKHKVEKLSMVIDNTCEVIRDGVHSEISTKEIVLDDIFISRAGLQMPVDSIIKSGVIEVDESILTGESVPVKKSEGDYVLAASVVVSGEAIMRADKVGKDCYIENVARVARRVNKPRSTIFSILDKVIKGISIALVFLAGLLLISILVTGAESTFLIESGADLEKISKFQSIVITISAAILGMLPIGMFLLTSTALAASTIKFAKRNTLPQDLYSIEMIAMVDTLLLDKTGTITDGKLEVLEEKIFTNEKIKVDEIFATIVHATKDQNSTANAIREHYLYAKTIEYASYTAFSSARKFSAITLNNGVNYIMGAPDFITRNTTYVEEFVQENAQNGRRTLALVEYRGNIEEFTPEKGRCLAVISLEDKLRGDVKETLDWFRENDVDIKIISGDNPVTVSQIAIKAGVHNAENYVNCKGLSDEDLEKIVETTTIFGRVSPEQKQKIVNLLQAKGRVVGMVGDGVNDVQALKEADCSISFASANEVARNISRIILMDNNFKTIPSIVQEGRQVISNIQKVSSLYIMKNLFVMFMVLMFTILTFITETNSYPFDTKRMLLIEFFVIGVPTFCFALQPNKARATDKFLSNIMKASIPSAIGLISGVMFIFGMLGCFKGDLTGFANPQTASTAAVGLAAAGFACLVIISMPPDWFRLGLITAMLGVATLALWADYYYAEMLFGSTFLNIDWMIPLNNWLLILGCTGISVVVTLLFRFVIEKISKQYGDRIYSFFENIGSKLKTKKSK